MPDQHIYDAIVVGSGASGGWAAKELTEKGLKVLLLEAGRTIVPEKDFPLPPPTERRLLSRAVSSLSGQSIQARCAGFNEKTRDFFVNDRENPYTTPSGKPFNWFRGRQIGGRLHVWARMALRLSEDNFKGASRDGYGVDWPISYGDLAPYYDKVETFLGLHGSHDGLAALPDGKYIRPHNLTCSEAAFKRAIEHQFPERRVISARVVPHSRERIPLTIQAAQRTGRLVVRSDAVVSRVSVDQKTGRATGVCFIDRMTRKASEVRGHSVVLCASTIETLRILLNSASSRHPQGLGNSSGRMGHYFMDLVLAGLGGPLPGESVHPQNGEEPDPFDFGQANGFYIPWDENQGSLQRGFLRGYGIQGAVGRNTPTWYLLAQGEMLPRFDNKVTLDPHRTDAWGIPVAQIDCTFGSNEKAKIADQVAMLKGMAAAAGFTVRMPPSGNLLERIAFRVWRKRLLSPYGAFLPGTAAHELGGAGMGDDPKRFVLNRFNQCWDAPNLFVTDGACFVSGCCQNTTLTIMALTARACDYLAGEHRTGRLQATSASH